jgi:hypothetical protein
MIDADLKNYSSVITRTNLPNFLSTFRNSHPITAVVLAKSAVTAANEAKNKNAFKTMVIQKRFFTFTALKPLLSLRGAQSRSVTPIEQRQLGAAMAAFIARWSARTNDCQMPALFGCSRR